MSPEEILERHGAFLPPLLVANRPPPKAARFRLEDWNDIDFNPNEEWLVEDVLPLRGLGLVYGKPRSFKSFVAKHLACCIVLGALWAGKQVRKGKVVYIAAEGAAGLRKRIAAYRAKHKISRGDFSLISDAPNLGTGDGDLPALISAVERAGVRPAMIVIDTAAKSIGSAEENGAGMAAFIGNAEKLAKHFDCLVLAIHHVGLGEDAQKRPRGWSGLNGALDVQLLCERPGDEYRTTLTVQKLKDGEDGVYFEAHLSRVVVGLDKKGKEASTLLVDDVTHTEATTKIVTGKRVPASQQLLSDTIAQAIDESGETFRPFHDGACVRAVHDECVRERYYAAVAEKAGPSDDPEKVAERQRRTFNRAVKAEIDAKRLTAKADGARRLLWLP